LAAAIASVSSSGLFHFLVSAGAAGGGVCAAANAIIATKAIVIVLVFEKVT
jgi:hypothetical protein